jgi:hypothetical protein
MSYESRLASFLALALVAVGCTDGGPFAASSRTTVSQPSANPAPNPPSAPFSPIERVQRGSLVVDGVVEEASDAGVSSLGNDAVNVWVQQPDGFGYSYWWANGPVYADASGRFAAVGLPTSVTVYAEAHRDGYVQQCTAAAPAIRGNVTINLRLVRLSNVSASPSSLPPQGPGMRYIAGTIHEAGPEGKRPAAGVYVSYEPVSDVPAASTITDSDGRYLLCGIPSDKVAIITAYRDGQSGFTQAVAGRTDDVDFELK